MLQKVGYSLIDKSNTEIMFWGNVLDMFVSSPDRIVLPGKIVIEGAAPYEKLYDEHMLVERWIESNPKTEIDIKTSETIEFRDDKTVVVYNYDLPTLYELKVHVKNKIANKRWEVETGGIEIDQKKFSTDRESQTKYTAIAVSIAQSDPTNWSINWKTNDGSFVTLNAQEMSTVINLILGHVQSSFNREFDLITQIDSCETIDEILEIDINSNWPPNEYFT